MKWIVRILIVLALAVGGIFAWGYQRDLSMDELLPKYANAESEFVTLDNGMRVHVRDQGDPAGEVIVFVHGSTASLHTWEPWIAQLGADYREISLTLGGHGLTGPHPDHDYSMAEQARLVHEVLQKMRVENYTIVGSSMGGFVSWLHTVMYPDGVERLVLIGASGFGHLRTTEPPFVFQLMANPVIGPMLKNITPRSLVANGTRAAYNNSPMIDDELIDRYFKLLLREGNREATSHRMAAPRDHSAVERMDEIGVPTLLMWGAQDALVPVEDAEHFMAAIPQAKKVIYPDLGHLPFEEAPERSLVDFRAFMNGEL